LLAELANVPEPRTAHFVTVICVAYPDGSSTFVEGELDGVITSARAGDQGFGYDPVFAAREAGGRTLAELTPGEKNDLSHRGRALRALSEKLAER
jgi:XTP/dITP diphosphohydrolase